MSSEILRFETKESLSDAIAQQLVTVVEERLREQDTVHLCLTGGSMGSAVWASVAAYQDSRDAGADFSRVHVWWGDERYLPRGDADRNDTQNDEAGLDRVGIPETNVHRVLGPEASDSAEASAAAYAKELDAAGCATFDVVLLGVGPDGHVASLFPGHPAQLSGGATVAVHNSPKPPPDRVSLTFERLRAADLVWFIVAGGDKAPAVASAIAGAPPESSSAAQVRGQHDTVWWVDADAASEL